MVDTSGPLYGTFLRRIYVRIEAGNINALKAQRMILLEELDGYLFVKRQSI
jgi:hypothetical protein